MDKPTQISREDLLTIQNSRANVNYQKVLVEKAELQSKNIVLMVYMKYGLTANDGIDFSTGHIVREETELTEELSKQEVARSELLEQSQNKEDNETK